MNDDGIKTRAAQRPQEGQQAGTGEIQELEHGPGAVEAFAYAIETLAHERVKRQGEARGLPVWRQRQYPVPGRWPQCRIGREAGDSHQPRHVRPPPPSGC